MECQILGNHRALMARGIAAYGGSGGGGGR